MSLPPREAWIEIHFSTSQSDTSILSLPPREAWIEIVAFISAFSMACVASPAGSVD